MIKMTKNETEIWQAHPGIPGIEVSTFGNVRTLDRLVSSEKYTRFTKGRILKQYDNGRGYLNVSIPIDGKWTSKRVHRLVAQTFIKNPYSLPEINHKDGNKTNNNVSNIEWCTGEYNIEYREKYGKALNRPVYAVNLKTLETYHFNSQSEAGWELGISSGNINNVIKGRLKQAGGYWFKEDDGNGIEIDNDKLNYIADSIPFTGGVFAVNLNTLEVSRFKSQSEAGMVLGIGNRSISAVIKVRRNQTHGFWFVNDDGHAVDVVKSKLHDIGKTGLKI